MNEKTIVFNEKFLKVFTKDEFMRLYKSSTLLCTVQFDIDD